MEKRLIDVNEFKVAMLDRIIEAYTTQGIDQEEVIDDLIRTVIEIDLFAQED